VIAYGCLIRKGARREHLDYIYRGLMSHHQHAKVHCNIFAISIGSNVTLWSSSHHLINVGVMNMVNANVRMAR
jgi:hypothetical protein